MLTYRQLKAVGKPYTNISMTVKCVVRYDVNWWGNGFIAFAEEVPKKLAKTCDVVELPTLSDILGEWISAATVEVFPVEVRPVCDGEYVLCKLVARSGETLWVDARYLTAIMKRAKRQKDEVHIFYNKAQNTIVAKLHSIPLAVLMHFRVDAAHKEPDWSLKNEDLPESQSTLL